MKSIYSAIAIALLALTVGCGGGEDETPDTDSGGVTLDDGTTLEKSLNGIFANNGLEDFTITDDEIRIELDTGSSADPSTACMLTSSINPALLEGRSIVVAFPDGEATCPD